MTTKEQLLEQIRVQGDLVRKLKGQKAPKEEVRTWVDSTSSILPRHKLRDGVSSSESETLGAAHHVSV